MYALEQSLEKLNRGQWARLGPKTWRCNLCEGKTIDRGRHGSPDRTTSPCADRMGARWVRRQRVWAQEESLIRIRTSSQAGAVGWAVAKGYVHEGNVIARIPLSAIPIPTTNDYPRRVYRQRYPGDRHWPMGYASGSSRWWINAFLFTVFARPWSYKVRAEVAHELCTSRGFAEVWNRVEPTYLAAETLKKRSAAPLVRNLLKAYTCGQEQE